MTHPRTRADELSIISSSKPGWELTPLHDATKIIKELEERIRELEDRIDEDEENHT